MSSSATRTGDSTPQDLPAYDADRTDTERGTPSNDAPAAPRFAKVLKAKKKQKRLLSKLSHEELNVAEQCEYEPRQPQMPDTRELEAQETYEQTKELGQEPTRGHQTERQWPKERLPKNRRKREARAAAELGEGNEQDTGAQVEGKPGNGKRQAQGEQDVDDRKRQGRKVGAGGAKRADDTEEEAPAKKEPWQAQKAALKGKFPEGWSPRKRLSPDALAGIRALHQQFPDEYTTDVLANKFEVSPEAIRRILKSKWEPAPEEEIERQERWFNRGKRIWSAWAEEGKKPPSKWRKEGIIRDPSYHEQRQARSIAQRKLAKTLM